MIRTVAAMSLVVLLSGCAAALSAAPLVYEIAKDALGITEELAQIRAVIRGGTPGLCEATSKGAAP